MRRCIARRNWILGCALLWPTLALAAQRGRLYVDNSAGDDLTIIDLESLKAVGTIRLAEHIHGLAVQADGRRLFSTVESDNTLRVVDTATGKVLKTVKLSGRPNQCAVTPNGRYVAVPIRDRGGVDIVDVAEGKVVKTLPVKTPHNAFNAGSNRYLFVSSKGSNEINLIDLSKMDYAAHIPLDGVPRPYVVTPDAKTLYVAESNLHGFVKVDIATHKILRRVAIPAENPKPRARRYEPIDTLTHGLALSPDGSELWVTSLLDNSLYIYDVKQNRVVGQVRVGEGPNWVAFSPDGKYVCVSNTDTDDVSIIDVKGRREVARIKVGKAPKRIVASDLPT